MKNKIQLFDQISHISGLYQQPGPPLILSVLFVLLNYHGSEPTWKNYEHGFVSVHIMTSSFLSFDHRQYVFLVGCFCYGSGRRRPCRSHISLDAVAYFFLMVELTFDS